MRRWFGISWWVLVKVPWTQLNFSDFQPKCPENWILLKHNSKCVQYVDAEMTRNEAINECQQISSNKVTLLKESIKISLQIFFFLERQLWFLSTIVRQTIFCLDLVNGLSTGLEVSVLTLNLFRKHIKSTRYDNIAAILFLRSATTFTLKARRRGVILQTLFSKRHFSYYLKGLLTLYLAPYKYYSFTYRVILFVVPILKVVFYTLEIINFRSKTRWRMEVVRWFIMELWKMELCHRNRRPKLCHGWLL